MMTFLQNSLFSIRDERLVIPVIISFILITLSLFHLSKIDIKHRELENFKLILALYPLAIISGIAIYGLSGDFFIGFFGLMSFLYFTEIYYDIRCNRGLKEEDKKTYVGGADILVAPLFTVWWGVGIIIYGVILLLVLIIATTPKIAGYLSGLCENTKLSGKDYIPLIPCLFIAYIICCFLMFLV